MKHTIIYWLVTRLYWLFAKIFFRLRVVFADGEEPVFNMCRGPVIIASNHASYLDPLLIAGIWPNPLHFFASTHLFEKSRFLSWMLKKLHTHPLKRGHGVSAMKEAIRLITQEQTSVVLFPEGTRSTSGRLQKLQDGVSFIAWKSKAMIIPVSITGTYDIWPRRARFPKVHGKIVVRFGSPIDVRDPRISLTSSPKISPGGELSSEELSSKEAISRITEALSQALSVLESSGR